MSFFNLKQKKKKKKMQEMNYIIVIFLLIALLCHGDVYLHYPRGSNNRLNEKSAARNNGNRLFDSQNNNRGGYNVGDRTKDAFDTNNYEFSNPDDVYDYDDLSSNKQYPEIYYEGSEITIEWTSQHACGGYEDGDPHKVNCNMVIQYMCDIDVENDRAMTVKLRNGGNTNTPTEPNSYADTADNDDQQTGRHESKAYYYECKKRQRNKGLFTADQKLKKDYARYTRQNPNGNRRGLECPEERDYYPYWSPSPWIDLAYITDDVSKCDYIKSTSQNNNDVYKCTGKVENDETIYITENECTSNGGTWTKYNKGLSAPECKQAKWSRSNHLGNGRENVASNFTISLPSYDLLQSYNVNEYGDELDTAKCVLRLRYNISTDDYDPWNTNSTHNDILNNNPTVDVGTSTKQGLKLAINTAQFGRTFQDRTHYFYLAKKPNKWSNKKIINLNVRGKRGNIVQTYPAVEYDFIPNNLKIDTSTLLHIQWTGSNTHNNGANAGDGQAGDAGQGQTGTDRNNMVIMTNEGGNYPIPLDKDIFDDINLFKQSTCYTLDGTAISWQQCAIILATSGYGRDVNDDFSDFSTQMNNAPASLIGGIIMEINTKGTYYYISSRNNNFSNRSQKGKITVV